MPKKLVNIFSIVGNQVPQQEQKVKRLHRVSIRSILGDPIAYLETQLEAPNGISSETTRTEKSE